MAALSAYAEVTQLCDTHGTALDELGFVHELPTPVVLEGSKLALPYAVLVSLVSEAERRLAAARLTESQSLALSEAAPASRGVLLVNANHYDAWNWRRRLVVAGSCTLSSELALAALILSKHPKSAQAWEYRRWLRTRAGGTSWARDELTFAARVTHYYAKNYYAWTHRLWVLQAVATEAHARAVAGRSENIAASNADPGGDSPRGEAPAATCPTTAADVLVLTEDELVAAAAWQLANVGDHCAYHHERAVLALWVAACAPHLGSGLLNAARKLAAQALASQSVTNAESTSTGLEGRSASEAEGEAETDAAIEAETRPAIQTETEAESESESKTESATATDAEAKVLRQLLDRAAAARDAQQRYPDHEALHEHLRALTPLLRVLAVRMSPQHAAVLQAEAASCLAAVP